MGIGNHLRLGKFASWPRKMAIILQKNADSASFSISSPSAKEEPFSSVLHLIH